MRRSNASRPAMHRRDTKPLRPPAPRTPVQRPRHFARGASVVPPSACRRAPPCLADAVREVFDRLRVDQDTGERRRIYSKHVREALAEMGNWPASVVERAPTPRRSSRPNGSAGRLQTPSAAATISTWKPRQWSSPNSPPWSSCRPAGASCALRAAPGAGRPQKAQ